MAISRGPQIPNWQEWDKMIKWLGNKYIPHLKHAVIAAEDPLSGLVSTAQSGDHLDNNISSES
jgi:hypothetical protein